MDGVEILSTFQYDNISFIGLIGLLMIIFGVLFTVGFIISKMITLAVITIIISIIGIGVTSYDVKTNIKTRFEAIIDDQVTFLELLEKYNIIEQHGEIWILEEKLEK